MFLTKTKLLCHEQTIISLNKLFMSSISNCLLIVWLNGIDVWARIACNCHKYICARATKLSDLVWMELLFFIFVLDLQLCRSWLSIVKFLFNLQTVLRCMLIAFCTQSISSEKLFLFTSMNTSVSSFGSYKPTFSIIEWMLIFTFY